MYDAALDLLRRLDPCKVEENLRRIIELEPELAEDLLSSVDVTLKVQRDDKHQGKQYLCCDYNRDGDSYRSPWSNEYIPALNAADAEEAPVPGETLRQMEILCNKSFEIYKDLYYEGGYSSAYLWELDAEDPLDEFAGVVLLKKAPSNLNHWDSVHVVEVNSQSATSFEYKLTSTIILDLGKQDDKSDAITLAGNLNRQLSRTIEIPEFSSLSSAQKQEAHVANLGTIIEDLESQMRNMLEIVYFGKTRDLLHEVKNGPAGSDNSDHKAAQAEIIKGLQDL